MYQVDRADCHRNAAPQKLRTSVATLTVCPTESLHVGAGRMETQLIDVLDRILDKGIVIDAWARFSIVGID